MKDQNLHALILLLIALILTIIIGVILVVFFKLVPFMDKHKYIGSFAALIIFMIIFFILGHFTHLEGLYRK
jgi:hypothetical protein